MKTIAKTVNKLILLLAFFTFLTGCSAKIGDSCTYDADCSAEGDRTCDNSQPSGYCLIITCNPDRCPGEAACVEFITPAPEFETDDTDSEDLTPYLYEQLEPNRTRTYCLAECKKDKDCRSGYYCADNDDIENNLNARIIDENSSPEGICIPKNTTADTESATESDTESGTDTETASDN
ncbi:MAG: hypothetical protein JXR91_11055 [Deltaproteobacteria bacterium]|nr:hypothetical protein [Deltaproteobacteria bacterium]